jgi:hypothetical protein
VIVVVYHDQLSELQVTSHGSSLTNYAFHGTTIAKERKRIVVNQLIPWLVEDSCGVPLSHSQTDSVREALAERASSDLYSGSSLRLRMARRDTIYLLGTSQGLCSKLTIVYPLLTRKLFRSSMLTA